MENIIKIGAYLRVSTTEQAQDGYWLSSQRRILKSYIEANKDQNWESWNALIYKDEWISWATKAEERPAMRRLMIDIIEKKIDIVIIYRFDRLFRSLELLLNFIRFIKENKVNLISKTESIDINSNTGWLMLAMIWAVSELERATIQERTSDWKISKALLGYYVNWMIPYWYSKEHDWKGNKLIINESEANIVKKVYKMYLEENWTIMGIRNYLTSLWIWTRQDKTGKPKLSTNFIHYSFVNKILRNEVYTWKYPFNKGKTGCRNWIREKDWIDKTKWLYLDCPEIINRDIFEKVQEKINKWKIMNGRWEKHIFTWLLKCWHCWKSLVYYKSKKWTWNYRCTWRNKTK